MPSFMDRLRRSYNILRNVEESSMEPEQMITSTVPSSIYGNRTRYDTQQAILAPIITRISVDAAAIPIKHILVDELDQFVDVKRSELYDRLNIAANIDQTGTAFIQDAVVTMLQEGVCVLVPIEVSNNPDLGTYDILSIRVGRVSEWFNYSVKVDVYNELIGDRTQITLPKSFVAICYNPFYAVMNQSNSTLRRLIDKLSLLDQADANLYSKQLDLILQLPYTLKNERRETEAARRLQSLEEQLYERKYGVAYIDATEKITQLNRPVTNALFETIESLTSSLHSQLGLTPSIFTGTATQEEMVQYYNRTILPIMKSLTDSMVAAFFSRTAISQGNSIRAFPNLFKMAPLEVFAEAADKFTRNEIMTSNEVRAVVGMKPSDDPDADALRNKNLNKADNQPVPEQTEEPVTISSNGSQ